MLDSSAEFDDDMELKKIKSVDQPRSVHWLTAGSVRFEDVTMRYRPDLPPALANLSFRVGGGKKVGIVGRSGCGKSTCLAALFRMVRGV
jgi:ABC-type bacteriocin/lantibiotic exporter with double-glycine peptidase domain